MVIWSEFRMWRYRDGDHLRDASCVTHPNLNSVQRMIITSSIAFIAPAERYKNGEQDLFIPQHDPGNRFYYPLSSQIHFSFHWLFVVEIIIQIDSIHETRHF